VLAILDQITRSMSLTSAGERREDGFEVLRKALGYGWSVAAAGAPRNAKPYLEKWLRSTDKDVAWVMRSNLRKARMEGLRDSLVPAPVRKTPPKKRAG